MTDRDPGELSPEQWEKKAELSLRNGDFGDALKYAHYANVSDLGYDPTEEGGYREEDEGYDPTTP